jgi:hypothetical protein
VGLVELPFRIINLQSRKLKGYEFHSKYKRGNVIAQCKKADPQMAHLVFSDTQANAQKTKRAIFCQRRDRSTRQLFKHFLS